MDATSLNLGDADLIFEFGYLKHTSSGKKFKATSGGTKGAMPLPAGWYICSKFWDRDVSKVPTMEKHGVCYSVNLEPLFPTSRTLLRIHPDGKLPGTQGCIGVQEKQAECRAVLKTLLPNGRSFAFLYVRTTF